METNASFSLDPAYPPEIHFSPAVTKGFLSS